MITGATGSTPAGTTSGPIKIGILLTTTSNAAAFGVSTGNTYSEQDIDNAVVSGLNAQGGLSGRKIMPIYAKTDTGSSNTEGDFAAACQTFTSDNHVAAVLGYNYTYFGSFESCLAKRGIPHLSTGYNVPDKQELSRYPLFKALDIPTIDRRGLVKLEGAVADGVLTSKSKIGIGSDTCPGTQRSLNDIILPKAKALGLNVVKTTAISCTDTTAAQVSALQSAQLQFASAGVDQVIFHSVSEGPALLLFSESAEAQHYRPGYIVTSLATLDELSSFTPAAQKKNVNVYGWLPTLDVPPTRYPKPNAQQTRCLDLLRAKGIKPSAGQDYFNAYSFCESLFVYQLALNKTGGVSTGGQVLAAIDSLGSSFPSVINMGGSQFSSSFPDAPRSARHLVYATSCSCFNYVGPERPIPTS